MQYVGKKLPSEFMMGGAIGIALSGMRASELRVVASANNIANSQSTRARKDGSLESQVFIPTDVVQLREPHGGTFAYTKESVGKSPVTLYDPDTGITQMPNVDLAEELVKAQEASFVYKSNLKVIGYASSLLGSFTDMYA